MMIEFAIRVGLGCTLILGLGCDSGGGTDTETDGGLNADAQGSDCHFDSISPSWVQPSQERIVAMLTGEQEISSGVSLPERSTEANREQSRQFIEAELASLGFVPERHNYGTGINVIASLPGSESGVYIVGAHYDSVPNSPGANDNATGVAAVLANARFLQDPQCEFRYEIRFVFFDEEELGLVGSRAYAAKLVADSVPVLGVFTIDQWGWDGDEDRQVEIELAPSGELQVIEQSIARHGLNVPVVATSTAGSDHTAFREQGFAALGFTEEFVNGDTTPHYHLATDTYSTIDFEFLASSTGILNAYVWDLVSPSK